MNKENASKLWKIIQEAGDYLKGQLPDHPNHPKGRNPYAHVAICVKSKFKKSYKDYPLISVIVPNLNGKNLRNTIDSILKQSGLVRKRNHILVSRGKKFSKKKDTLKKNWEKLHQNLLEKLSNLPCRQETVPAPASYKQL